MSKGINLLIAVQLLITTAFFGNQFPISAIGDTIQITEEPLPQYANYLNLSFSLFKNDVDSTGKILKTGSVKFTWDKETYEGIAEVRYRFNGDKDWTLSDTIQFSKGSITIQQLPENKFGEWSLGSNSKWSEPNEFHTLGKNLFKNFAVKEGPESAKLTWSIDYHLIDILANKGIKSVITYNTSIGEKRHKEGLQGGDWSYTEPFDITTTKFEFYGGELDGNTKYGFKIGIAPNTENIEDAKGDKSQMIWSKKAKCKTERGWGIGKLLILIGALGFFIFGMKLMSEGLQQAAGSKLRSMLKAMTSNRIKGVFTGFGITSIVQSSSVTSVMTVSFVNAGLMSLKQSAGVMMGANVGTTITAWLVLFLGFKLSISSYAFMIIAIAAPLLFIQKGTAKAWASAIFGFCILFIGLEVLKDSVPELDGNSAIVQFFLNYKDVWYGPMFFVILGTIVTVVIQSSSAAMALTLAMVNSGAIPFEVACAMILGENIGTTITAQLAALVGNVHAKRSAQIHSIFNLVGVVWMLLIFPLFLKALGWLVIGDPFTDVAVAGTTIALFHTAFNLINVFLLIWFVPQLVNIAERTVKSKGEADEEFKLDFIDGPLGSTAELCLMEAQKEVSKFGTVTGRMNVFANTLTNSSDNKEKNKMLTKLEKYEEITDRVEVEVATYLGKTATLEMSDSSSMKMRAMLSITNDLERIGDIYFQMGKAFEKKDDKKRYFTPEQRDGLNKINKVVGEAFEIMIANLESRYGTISLEGAREKEREINQLRNRLKKEHHTSMKNPEYNMQSAVIYSDLYSSYEKVGDHVINVSEAVAGEI